MCKQKDSILLRFFITAVAHYLFFCNKVAETGKPDELYKQGGIYTRMVDLQNIAQGWTIGRQTN